MGTEDRVKKILTENSLKGVSPEELRVDTPLIEYGVGLDSVATLALLVALEEEFQIRIDESGITSETFETIQSISNHVNSIVQGAF